MSYDSWWKVAQSGGYDVCYLPRQSARATSSVPSRPLSCASSPVEIQRPCITHDKFTRSSRSSLLANKLDMIHDKSFLP
jgi:hypothetical protein